MVNNQPKTQDTQQNESINREATTDTVVANSLADINFSGRMNINNTTSDSAIQDLILNTSGDYFLYTLTSDIVLTSNRHWGSIYYDFKLVYLDLNGHQISCSGGVYDLWLYGYEVYVYDSSTAKTGRIIDVHFIASNSIPDDDGVVGTYVSVYIYGGDIDFLYIDTGSSMVNNDAYLAFYEGVGVIGGIYRIGSYHKIECDINGGTIRSYNKNDFSIFCVAPYMLIDYHGCLREKADQFRTIGGQQYAVVDLYDGINRSQLIDFCEHNNYRSVFLKVISNLDPLIDGYQTWDFVGKDNLIVRLINGKTVQVRENGRGQLLNLGETLEGLIDNNNTHYFYPVSINGSDYAVIDLSGSSNHANVVSFCNSNGFNNVKFVLSENYQRSNTTEVWSYCGGRFQNVVLDLHGHNIECKSLTIQANQIRVEGPGQIQCTATLELDTASCLIVGDDNITLRASRVNFKNCQGVTLPYALYDYSANKNHPVQIVCDELYYNGALFPRH